MNKYLIGSKKHGCLIDNEQQVIIYYDLLSNLERLKGKKQKQIFYFKDIQECLVTYGIQDLFRSSTITITLTIKLKNQTSVDATIFFNNTTRDELISFIQVLKKSSLVIKDPYHIFNQIETSQKTLWDIISSIEKQRFENRK